VAHGDQDRLAALSAQTTQIVALSICTLPLVSWWPQRPSGVRRRRQPRRCASAAGAARSKPNRRGGRGQMDVDGEHIVEQGARRGRCLHTGAGAGWSQRGPGGDCRRGRPEQPCRCAGGWDGLRRRRVRRACPRLNLTQVLEVEAEPLMTGQRVQFLALACGTWRLSIWNGNPITRGGGVATTERRRKKRSYRGLHQRACHFGSDPTVPHGSFRDRRQGSRGAATIRGGSLTGRVFRKTSTSRYR